MGRGSVCLSDCYQKEYDNGVRGVLFDVDNTLVRHGEPATKQAKELFEHLRGHWLKNLHYFK